MKPLPLYRVPCPRCHGTGIEPHRFARCRLCDGAKLVSSREPPPRPGSKAPRAVLGPQGLRAVSDLAKACERIADNLRRARGGAA